MRCKIFDLGLVDFSYARAFQLEAVSAVEAGETDAALIFCRHNPVITIGRAPGSRRNIIVPGPELFTRGIALEEAERGGNVTYHGPGQVIAYPICNLARIKKDLHYFLRQLEEAGLRALSSFGLRARRRAGLTGIWVGERKIASLGIAVRRWISFHGMSMNVKVDDLKNYSFIRPCGMDIALTSIESESGRKVTFEEVAESLRCAFGTTLGFEYSV